MYITTDNEQLQALYDEQLMGDHYDPPGVEFRGGTAQVVEEVGERLAEAYDGIAVKESDNE